MPLPEIDNFDDLGGRKYNYSQVRSPTTDVDAEQYSKMCYDVAASTYTATRAWVKFTGHATAPVLVASNAVWGNEPSVIPTVVHTATGVYTITFPTTVDDGLLQATSSHTVNARAAIAQVESTLGTAAAQAVVSGPNTVIVYTFSSTAANNLAGVNVNVIVL